PLDPPGTERDEPFDLGLQVGTLAVPPQVEMRPVLRVQVQPGTGTVRGTEELRVLRQADVPERPGPELRCPVDVRDVENDRSNRYGHTVILPRIRGRMTGTPQELRKIDLARTPMSAWSVKRPSMPVRR